MTSCSVFKQNNHWRSEKNWSIQNKIYRLFSALLPSSDYARMTRMNDKDIHMNFVNCGLTSYFVTLFTTISQNHRTKIYLVRNIFSRTSYFVRLRNLPIFRKRQKPILRVNNVWLDLKISHNRNDFISPIECCYSSMQNVITYLTFNILYGVTEHHIRWNSYMVFEHQIRYSEGLAIKSVNRMSRIVCRINSKPR